MTFRFFNLLNTFISEKHVNYSSFFTDECIKTFYKKNIVISLLFLWEKKLVHILHYCM